MNRYKCQVQVTYRLHAHKPERTLCVYVKGGTEDDARANAEWQALDRDDDAMYAQTLSATLY